MPRGRPKKNAVKVDVKDDKKDKKKSKSSMNKSELMKRIDAVCAAVKKTCPSEWSGDDPITTLKADKISKIPTFKTGSLSLDKCLGGGYAWGRIVEVYGQESSGKSTLMLHAIANVQQLGDDHLCALVDSENSFDPIYAQNLGVNVERLLVSQPDSGEHALNIMMELIRNDVKLVIVDSVAALTPKDMFEAAIGTVTMGKHAKMMSEGLRNLNTLLSKKRSTVIFTNQIRTQIGVAHASMGSGTTGGKALRFYASQRIEMKRIGSDKSGEEIVNNIVKSKVAKNKIAPPFQIAVFKIRFGKGIDPIEQILDFAIDFNIIEKSGAWFGIPILGDARFQGRQNMYAFLEKDLDSQKILFDAIAERMKRDDEGPDEEVSDDSGDDSDSTEDLDTNINDLEETSCVVVEEDEESSEKPIDVQEV